MGKPEQAPRAGLYIRVSTEEQAREGFSVPAQRDRLLAFGRSQGWTVAGIYADEGYSGARLDRPGLARLREDVRARRVNMVLVWRVDRLSRRLSHLAQLVEEFDRGGAALRSVSEPFDTGHAAGRLFLQILGSFAEFERESIRERTRLGIAQRVRAGLVHGRPVPIGYRLPAPGAPWEVDEEGAAVVRWIYSAYLRGEGTRRIAAALIEGVDGLPSHRVRAEFGGMRPSSVADRVRWILHNPVYAGYAPLGDRLYPGRHPAIVTPEDWHTIQAIFAGRRRGGRRAPSPDFLLTGRIICGACGAPMWGRREDGAPRGKRRPRQPRQPHEKRYYYVCANSSLFQGRRATCSNWVRRDLVEEAVVGRIRALELTPEAVADAELPQPAQEILETKRTALQGLQRRQRRLVEALETAPALEESLLERLRALAEEQRRLEEEIRRLEADRPRPVSREEALELVRRVGQVWEWATPDERRQLIRVLLRRVRVWPRPERRIEVELARLE